MLGIFLFCFYGIMHPEKDALFRGSAVSDGSFKWLIKRGRSTSCKGDNFLSQLLYCLTPSPRKDVNQNPKGLLLELKGLDPAVHKMDYRGHYAVPPISSNCPQLKRVTFFNIMPPFPGLWNASRKNPCINDWLMNVISPDLCPSFRTHSGEFHHSPISPVPNLVFPLPWQVLILKQLLYKWLCDNVPEPTSGELNLEQ